METSENALYQPLLLPIVASKKQLPVISKIEIPFPSFSFFSTPFHSTTLPIL